MVVSLKKIFKRVRWTADVLKYDDEQSIVRYNLSPFSFLHTVQEIQHYWQIIGKWRQCKQTTIIYILLIEANLLFLSHIYAEKLINISMDAS